ncbi:MAG: SO_0444 family Cu/Zn efflux transporter [Prevotella sp.]|nr:SO_0444 family Cu/Zn efflux transporter [Prevotella sp.]
MEQIFDLVNEMSPYLLLGFLFAGILHVFVPGAVYSRYLSGHSFRSVLYATLLGVPLPLCSCGVIPTAMGLRKEGASKGATVSFLIATPETGVDSIAATYSLMGLPFAIVRPITACLTSLLAGTLINTFDKDTDDKKTDLTDDDTHCHHCHNHGEAKDTGTLTGKIKEVLSYAFIEMMQDIGKWLVVGLVIAGLITVFVPDSFFEVFKGNTLLSMLLVLCIAIPMYICATGSIPIAVALIMKGLTPGAALVLLMAGPACNMASLLIINKTLGRKTLLLYLISIISGAIAAGCIIDSMPAQWFMPTLMKSAAQCHEDAMPWFNIGCTILLILLLLNALYQHYAGSGHHHCHCHDENAGGISESTHECCCHQHKHDH